MNETQRQYHRDYHANRSPESKATKLQKQYARLTRIRQQIFDYLRDNSCVDCGETDPIVLEFDHVRDKKESVIAEMVRRGNSFERILTEIMKCDVRCANCHRRKTARDFNYYQGVV